MAPIPDFRLLEGNHIYDVVETEHGEMFEGLVCSNTFALSVEPIEKRRVLHLVERADGLMRGQKVIYRSKQISFLHLPIGEIGIETNIDSLTIFADEFESKNAFSIDETR